MAVLIGPGGGNSDKALSGDFGFFKGRAGLYEPEQWTGRLEIPTNQASSRFYQIVHHCG